MSDNKGGNSLKYKQVANVERRTWDLEAYEARAKARSKMQENDQVKEATSSESRQSTVAGEDKEEFRRADKGRAGPARSERAFLKAREHRVTDIDSRVGSADVVSDASVIKMGVNGVGWKCTVCDCVLKDSHAYLDHINGRRHQKALGYSMRVEKSTLEDVKAKLDQLKKQSTQKSTNSYNNETSLKDQVKEKDEELHRRRQERKKRKQERLQRQQQEEEQEEDEAEAADTNPDLAAIMGFSGFGGGK